MPALCAPGREQFVFAVKELRKLGEVLDMRACTVGDDQFVPVTLGGQTCLAHATLRSERIEPDHRTPYLPGSFL